MRLRSWACAVALLLGFAGAAQSQNADAVKFQNWDKIATAMVRALAQSRGVAMQSAIFGGFGDLNFDGLAELFAFTDATNCIPAECGSTVFELQGKQFTEIIDVPEQVKHTPANQVMFPNQKRNGHQDLSFGQTLLTYNGNRYVLASTLPLGSFNAKALQSACEKSGLSDYQLESHSVAKKQGRKAICGCMVQRFSQLGFDQAAADAAAKTLVKNGEQDDSETEASDTPEIPAVDEVSDARTGCLIQNGWSQWTISFATSDEKAEQVPLDYGAFIPKCAGQDWLESNARIGSPDRALSLCGCVARKLSARGWDQASLDGVGALYAAEIDEDALTAIRADGIDSADKDLDSCFNELPKL